MSENSELVTLEQMKASVGSLLFLWSDIERSLRAAFETELFAGTPSPVHRISQALGLWSERVLQAGRGRPLQTDLCQRLSGHLREALVVRNLVCHALIGYSADVPHLSQRAHLRVQLEKDVRLLTWGELQTMFRWMSRSRWLIADLTQAAMDKDAIASEKSLLGWQGFPEQG
ncbi:hypothetical protein FHG66_20365 [Rubellimicrobium rubrum]|uniref:Uncharacterized protein n=1 Tax=Rubellimicrobium rubrum TaxID=2585369 RepID=A0A5C4MIT4_9RHOB|nr:hypothetical protein [Rubellimicrobium rubrum]TNC45039.1 hypothetical protein FHG66_20365 [Rubellimicrobium rubrum]